MSFVSQGQQWENKCTSNSWTYFPFSKWGTPVSVKAACSHCGLHKAKLHLISWQSHNEQWVSISISKTWIKRILIFLTHILSSIQSEKSWINPTIKMNNFNLMPACSYKSLVAPPRRRSPRWPQWNMKYDSCSCYNTP